MNKLAYIFYNSKLPKWDGRNDTSSVLFYGEQGIGDQICLAKLITKLKGYKNQNIVIIGIIIIVINFKDLTI